MRVLGLFLATLSACVATAYAQTTRPALGAAAPAQTTRPAAVAPAADAPPARDCASYGIGLNMGRTLRSEGVAVTLETLFQGIKDGMQGTQPRYTEQQIRTAFDALNREVQAKQQAIGEKNKREGQAFLAANKAKAGVTTLPSGLQYQVTRAGTGATPKATDTVKVHYHGQLLDGTVFDSSIQRRQPVVLEVCGVIDGWTEALQRMKVGDNWRLFVPPELGYGAEGAGSDIGPHAVLVFDVELLGIEPPNTTAAPATPATPAAPAGQR